MLGGLAKSRLLWSALAALVGGVVLVLICLQRLSAGPIPLAFLDRPIADAIAGLAPGLTAEVGETALARSGRGVALRVSGVRLAARDGTPILSLPELSLRPSLGALLRGRIVLARVDVADAALVLTRRSDGAWVLGSDEGGAGVAVLELFGTQSAETRREQGLPYVGLTRTHVTVDDQRAGGRIDLADGELLLAPRVGHLDVTLSAALHLESAVPPVPGVLQLPIRGEASVALTDEGALGAVDFTLAGGMGELALAGDAGAPFALADLVAVGRYDPAVETLRFERLAAQVGASRVEAKTTVTLGTAPTLALAGTVDALAMTTLTRFWPAASAAAARTWLVANVRDGMLRRCRVQLGLRAASPPAPGGSGNAPAATAPPVAEVPDAIDVACDFDGVTASYLAPLDPIRAASGSARLTAARLEVHVRAGQVGACRVEGGKLVMNLAVDPPRAEITADVSGAGADVLAIVDQPPLQLVAPLGITPKDLGGQSRVHAELRLPIKPRLTGAEVGVKATGLLVQASLPPLVGGIGINDGELEVRIEGRTFEVKGKTVVTGLPLVTTPVMLKLAVAPATGAGPQAQQIKLTLDGDGLAARGTASLAGSTLTGLVVERLRLGRSDVAGTLRRRPSGDYDATLTGANLDLEALLADPVLASGPAWADAAGSGVSGSLSFRLDRLRRSRDLEIRNLRGSVQVAGGKLATLALTGSLAPSGDFQATLEGPIEARRIAVTADQAGRMLQAFGGLEQIVGGRLKLEAVTDQRGPQEFVAGKLVLRDFKVVRAPVLAKVLGVGSLSGIAALVQGEGLPVSKARVPFRWEAERFVFSEVRAIGAVGLTADGVIDRRAKTCDVRGNIIPAYTLNSVLGKIPLLGRLLVGGKGQGVFGIDYRVTGKLADPAVSVNPLTSVAPTVLRKWFIDPFTRDPDDAPPAPR